MFGRGRGVKKGRGRGPGRTMLTSDGMCIASLQIQGFSESTYEFASSNTVLFG